MNHRSKYSIAFISILAVSAFALISSCSKQPNATQPQNSTPPSIRYFAPATGATGQIVTIVGRDLSGTTAVSFGHMSTSSFAVTGDTAIAAVVGAGETGKISVTSPGGTATSDSMFTYWRGSTAIVTGSVFRQGTTNPITGATVTVGNTSVATNSAGAYQLALPTGTYQLSVSAPRYKGYSGPISIASFDTITNSPIYMNYAPWAYIGIVLTTTSSTGWEFATGLNSVIYFATPNNSSSAQHFVAYDLTSNAYREKSLTGNDLCACGYNSRLVSANSKLFYFANSGTSYDSATNQWTGMPYPNPRGEPGVGVLGNDIYYVGGRGGLNTCQVFNATTYSWRTIPDYLYSTSWSAISSYNGRLYVLGGSGTENKISVYDTSSKAWVALPDIPFTNVSSRPTALTFDNKIFMFSSSAVYVFDPSTSSWDPSVLSSAGFGSIAVLAGNSMYVIGYSSVKGGYTVAKYDP